MSTGKISWNLRTTPKPENEIRSWKMQEMDFRTIRVVPKDDNNVIWQLSDIYESHDPMDRVGGPYRINDFIDDHHSWKEPRFYLVTIADSYFPPSILIRADDDSSALEALIGWCNETVSDEDKTGRYGLIIPPEEHDEHEDGFWSDCGAMADISNVHINHVKFHSMEA